MGNAHPLQRTAPEPTQPAANGAKSDRVGMFSGKQNSFKPWDKVVLTSAPKMFCVSPWTTYFP